MLENILNLEGVTVLDKKQQGSIEGGALSGTDCRIVIENSFGGRLVFIVRVPGYGQEAQFQGEAYCNNYEAGPDSLCYADCELVA